jgi:competence protein ComFC
MWRDFLGGVIDLVVPPRETDRLVRDLTLEDLLNIQTEDGLPYHDPAVRALVWELKYFANKKAAALAGELLAEELLALAQEEIGKPLLIPIPMHTARRRERGHNQTELLCVAALKHIPGTFEYAPRVLERTSNTNQQQGLERMKRLQNVKGSMRVVDPDCIAGRICIVVDDVSTTGATFTEAKRVLKEAKARRIICVALARS